MKTPHSLCVGNLFIRFPSSIATVSKSQQNFSEITITVHYTMHKLTQRWHETDTKLDSARLEYDLYLAVWAKVCDLLSIEQSSFMTNGSDGYLSIAKIIKPILFRINLIESTIP